MGGKLRQLKAPRIRRQVLGCERGGAGGSGAGPASVSSRSDLAPGVQQRNRYAIGEQGRPHVELEIFGHALWCVRVRKGGHRAGQERAPDAVYQRRAALTLCQLAQQPALHRAPVAGEILEVTVVAGPQLGRDACVQPVVVGKEAPQFERGV